MTTQDLRTRFIFDQHPVRGLHVSLNQVWQHIATRCDYPTAIRQALGELLLAASLLSVNLKSEGSLVVQIQGQGRLKMLVAEVSSQHTVRATARWDTTSHIDEQESLHDLLGKDSIFAITVQANEGEPWQGIVPLEGKDIATMLMNYMQRSEQIATQIVLAVNEQRAAGVLLQRLPDETVDDDVWQHFQTLTETITQDELLHLDAQNVLYRLFHETPPRVFEAETLEFACSCSREKVSNMLLLLGGQEVGQVVADEGSVSINCDFCNEQYVFDEHDVNELFGMDVVQAVCQETKVQ